MLQTKCTASSSDKSRMKAINSTQGWFWIAICLGSNGGDDVGEVDDDDDDGDCDDDDDDVRIINYVSLTMFY